MSFGVNTSNLSNVHENYEAGTQPKAQTKQFINSVHTAAFSSEAEEPHKEERNKRFINSAFTVSAYMP